MASGRRVSLRHSDVPTLRLLGSWRGFVHEEVPIVAETLWVTNIQGSLCSLTFGDPVPKYISRSTGKIVYPDQIRSGEVTDAVEVDKYPE